MSEIIVRKPYISEIPALYDIWITVFGSIGLESFFKHFFDLKLCIIAEFNNSPAAMGYIIPAGDLIYDGESIRCAMIYSIATLPDSRSMGLGAAVVLSLISLANELGYPAVVLCPSEDSLFEYYKSFTGLCDWFYVNERIIHESSIDANPARITEISVNEYFSLREKLLDGIVHIKQDLRILEYQALLCLELGGGLFRIGDSCAVVEYQTDCTLWVKELLTPEGIIDDLVSDSYAVQTMASIMKKFPAREYLVRSPSQINKGRRFGMLVIHENSYNALYESTTAPWFGMAFD